MTVNNEKRPVLVTTKHRGVFFGYLKGKPTKKQVVLAQCRNCIYWEVGVHGFIGLAANGPTSQCKIGPAAPEITLYDVTAVAVVTPEAAEKWEAAPWRS